MKTLGFLLLACGAAALLFGLTVDTTVATELGGHRVHNIGLMNDKQNILLVGAAITIVGAVLFGFGFGFANGGTPASTNLDERSSPDSLRNCPYCAEVIKAQAIVCRFCNRDVPLGDTVTIEKGTRSSHPGASREEIMASHGITFDGERYRYSEYKYDSFENALAYAKLQAAKGDAS